MRGVRCHDACGPRNSQAPEVNMFVLVRAITYAALFIGLVLSYAPARLLSWPGMVRPAAIEVPQVVGIVIGIAGAVVALWCILTFASLGRGTPAPFDPPRRLVIRGPYRFVPQSHVPWGRLRPGRGRALLRVVAAAPVLQVSSCSPLISWWSGMRNPLCDAPSRESTKRTADELGDGGRAYDWSCDGGTKTWALRAIHARPFDDP